MTLFLAQLDRFGYTLTCVGQSEYDVRKAILTEYKSAYKRLNGVPAPQSDYFLAKEELNITELPLGKVEWL